MAGTDVYEHDDGRVCQLDAEDGKWRVINIEWVGRIWCNDNHI